jgi:hypothetical protein
VLVTVKVPSNRLVCKHYPDSHVATWLKGFGVAGKKMAVSTKAGDTGGRYL